MRKRFICRRVLHSVLALASAAFFIHSASGEESPYATGGEVTVRDLGNFRFRYIHVFTNTAEAATFASTGKRDLKLRYLVVGGGGSGGGYYKGSTMGGGGGGGGGVCEKEDVLFESGATWQVLVGKGASSYSKTAGASSISNGVADVETVPGGGNGADAGTLDRVATAGASGGGASRRDGQYTGGLGTYTNSIFGVEYGPFKGGDTAANRAGAGGGGASENGYKNTTGGSWGKGGEGLASDITGASLVYGSGGGGCGKNVNDKNKHYQGGRGGSRAGNGGLYDASSNVVVAMSAEANSGGGGGGAAGWEKTTVGKGADGIVVIRYEVAESPCAGGDVITRTLKRGTTYTYLHKFTNVTEAAEFVNESGRDLKLRYLVVGAGGFGIGGWASNNGGGGGGGGGVCEKKDIAFANGVVWSVKVGKGSTSKTSVAGASVISNGTEEIELVPGGGNGGARASGGGTLATSGAAGGGGAMGDYKVAGKGTYQSSILGVTPEGTEPGKGFSGGTGSRCGAETTGASWEMVKGWTAA